MTTSKINYTCNKYTIKAVFTFKCNAVRVSNIKRSTKKSWLKLKILKLNVI